MVVKFTQQLFQNNAAWAVLDQVLFGASTFLANILLARLLPEAEYGVYALGFTLLMFIGGIQQPLLSEPMLVFSSSQFAQNPQNYQRLVLRWNWICALLVSGVFVVLYFAIPNSSLHAAFVGLALAAPFVLYSWLIRRICYANLMPSLSAKAGLLNLLMFLAGIAVVYSLGWLNVPVAFLVMGLAALVSSSWIQYQLQSRQTSTPADSALAATALREHWQYGRWGLLSNFLYYVPVLFPYWLLGSLYGLESSASLRALENLAMPLATVLGNLSSFLIPVFARHSGAALDRQVIRFALAFAAPALLYWLTLGLLYPLIMPLLYRDNYADVGNLLWLFALQPLFIGLSTVFLSTLKAAQKPHWLTAAYSFAALFMLAVGYGLIQGYGVLGAVGAMVATQSVLVLAGIWGWLVLRRQPIPETDPSP